MQRFQREKVQNSGCAPLYMYRSVGLVTATQTLPEAVATRVRVVIAEKGLTKKDLAEPLGIGPDQAYRKIRGDVPFSVEDLDIVASVLGVAPWEFFPGAPSRLSHAV